MRREDSRGVMRTAAAWLLRHKVALAAALALVLLGPTLVQSTVGRPELFVSATAPPSGRDLQVLVAVDPGLGGACDGTASVELELAGVIVYPAVFTEVPIRECQGTVGVPYAKFASENAQYLVRARFGDLTAETHVFVEKVVNWVYVRSFSEPEEGRARVDIALDSILNQPLSSSIFATGTLVLDVRWETCSPQDLAGIPLPVQTERCEADGDLVFHAELPVEDRASVVVFIPYDNLDSPKFDGRPTPGHYNVTATFHNDEAKGNYNVPMDPSVYQEEPPGNWFEVSYS